MTRPEITVDYQTLPWTGISLERSLGTAVGSFEVSFPLHGSLPRRPGGQAVLELPAAPGVDKEPLMVGFVDAASGRVNARSTTVTLNGRDATADLVDGFHEETPKAWSGASLLEIAQSLANPYGISVLDQAGAASLKVARLARQPGESTYSTLERAARQFGVLIGTSASGELLLGAESQGAAETQLVTGEGGNVKAWAWTSSVAERFAKTVVLGANDGGFGEILGGATVPTATALDPEIRARRQKEFVAQGQVLAEDCERLAEWHVRMARARAAALQVTLPSWRQRTGGTIWRPGLQVPITITEIGEESTLLTDTVRLRYTDAGEEASLSLIRLDSLLRDPSEGRAESGVGLAGLI